MLSGIALIVHVLLINQNTTQSCTVINTKWSTYCRYLYVRNAYSQLWAKNALNFAIISMYRYQVMWIWSSSRWPLLFLFCLYCSAHNSERCILVWIVLCLVSEDKFSWMFYYTIRVLFSLLHSLRSFHLCYLVFAK